MSWDAHPTADPEVWTVVNLDGPTIRDWRFIRDLTPEYARHVAAELNRRDLRTTLGLSLTFNKTLAEVA